MKLSVIIPVCNRHEITMGCLKNLAISSKTKPEIVILDNGSDEIFYNHFRENGGPDLDLNIVFAGRPDNIGVWPTFKWGVEVATGDILAFIHNDLYIYDENWDGKIIEAFTAHDRLGLVGFVGSTEWGDNGGRGGGTILNFQGRDGLGSPAEAHGRRITGLEKALQVDGCSMVMRRTAMDEIGYWDFPPHHFYDRLYSLIMLELAWKVGVYGIACDHISGQTANTQDKWQNTAKAWADANGVAKQGDNWDQTVYFEAERRFLARLKDFMRGHRMIRVNDAWGIDYV